MISEETANLILQEISRLNQKVDLLICKEEAIQREEAIRRAHDDPKALQDFLKRRNLNVRT